MFEIFGINFYWYGLLIGVGVWLAVEIAVANRGEIKKDTLDKAMLWAIFFGVGGARLYHIVDYWNRYYSTNFIKVFYFWEGGLGIWGAIGGGLFGLFIFCYFNKVKYFPILDKLVVGVPLAQAIGRVGNYINGELVGKNGEPLFAYEGLLSLLLFGILWKISKNKYPSGVLSGVYLMGYGIIRIALENFRSENIIWKFNGFPVAIMLGLVAIVSGSLLTFRRKQS